MRDELRAELVAELEREILNLPAESQQLLAGALARAASATAGPPAIEAGSWRPPEHAAP